MPDRFYDAGDQATHITRLEALRGQLQSERTTFDSHWRELGDFLLPRRMRFWVSDRNKGDRRNSNIIDSTARFAARTLQSGLHAGLTSPARPWMKLSTHNPDLMKHQAVKEWLQDVTLRMLNFFLQTNLYNVLPIVYGDMGVFGTGCMAVIEDTKDLFRCYAYPVGTYVLGVNRRGIVQTFIREYELSVRQVVEEFGVQPNGRDIDWSNISDSVKNLWNRGSYEVAVPIIWAVYPNLGADPKRLEAKYLPFTSCHYEAGGTSNSAAGSTASGGRKFLRESGFRSFPILAPRWDITGEDTYGTDCPGMTCLGDVKGLQIMQRRKAQAINKMIDPPLVGPIALRTQKTSLLPGDVTYVDTREGMQGLRSIHEVTLNIQHLREDIGETQYRIQRAFYEDLFLMLARSDEARGTQPVTAREIDERHEEKLLALGPVLERTNDELLDPLIDRVYGLMDAAGFVPPAPPELEGVALKVEYTSIMAQAQRLVGVVGLDRFVMSIAPLVQADPTLRHKINGFQIIDQYGEMLGVDPRTIRQNDEAEALARQEAKAIQAQQEADQAQKMAAAVKSAGTTPMEGDTALNRMLTNAGAATIQ